jgi:hypothetical protein
MLEYLILSSNKFNVYKVRFEGKGKDLKAYCTCPAGKKGGKFCKHISGLLNGDESNIIQPSDKIESLKEIIEGSPLLIKNKEFMGKRELSWFEINNDKINDVEGLYDYIKTVINDKVIIEHNKKLKYSNRIALYKAEYKKDGNPKYVRKNRLIYMEYADDLTYFKIGIQPYRHFSHAGKSFIEKIEHIMENKEYFKTKGKYAFKAVFSDGYTTGPFITEYNELDFICRRAAILLLSHIGYNKLKDVFIQNIYEIEMRYDKQADDTYYIVPHKIKKIYSEGDYKEIINTLLFAKELKSNISSGKNNELDFGK